MLRRVSTDTPAAFSNEDGKIGEQNGARDLMLQAFVPHIAVHTSTDTDDLTTKKGFTQGLWQLLRPFGERVQGKVTIRDSIGANRLCDDFAVRFIQLGDGLEAISTASAATDTSDKVGSPKLTIGTGSYAKAVEDSRSLRLGGNVEMIEDLVDRHLSYAETHSGDRIGEDLNPKDSLYTGLDRTSPFYTLYIKRLLSGIPMTAHETFSHPVACIIAISSRSSNPIETLRQLYDESSNGEKKLPVWVNPDYLRYYVLVHDEEKDDISKSMTLFEQMKRHFGLHCHLLRIRSSQCIPTDDDAMQLPPVGWLSAAEELAEIQERDAQEDVETTPLCLYESDATAIRTFIREMVTQSVVPSMERCVATWNDQVASRRRGLSGRFISLSKRWTGFGSGSKTSSVTNISGTASGSSSNYETPLGYYRPDAPEALMRKLADYAFMLRDWKLAQSTYDLVRSDFNNDKAWRYHAAANEMAALSALVSSQAINARTRIDTLDQLLDTATYSYLTRCRDPYGALRCLAFGVELLKLRGGLATDDATKWGSKLLEAKILKPVGDALVKERVAACYASRKDSGPIILGSRTRKAALWNILAADQWLSLRKYRQAEKRMRQVKILYDTLPNSDSLTQFHEAHVFLSQIQRHLRLPANADSDKALSPHILEEPELDEESEALDIRNHRKSIMGTGAPALAALETAPLHNLPTALPPNDNKADNFV